MDGKGTQPWWIPRLQIYVQGELGGGLNRLVYLCVTTQRLPNQPLIPTRVLDSDSNTSGGDDGSGDEDEDDDQDVASDEV